MSNCQNRSKRSFNVAACSLPWDLWAAITHVTGIWYVIGFAIAAGSFTFLTFGAAWLLSHRNRGDVHKGVPYESGIDTYGDTHGRFGLSFYIYALLFVAFDIEVVSAPHEPVRAAIASGPCRELHSVRLRGR